jgi:hypothetical protein
VEKPKFKKWNGARESEHGLLYADWYEKSEVDAYIDKLFKDAVKVSTHDRRSWFIEEASEPRLNTHQALLIQIEPIASAVCDHEPIHCTDSVLHKSHIECARCGKKLKAKWETE